MSTLSTDVTVSFGAIMDKEIGNPSLRILIPKSTYKLVAEDHGLYYFALVETLPSVPASNGQEVAVPNNQGVDHHE